MIDDSEAIRAVLEALQLRAEHDPDIMEDAVAAEVARASETDWLLKNTHFRERPAGIAEFLGPKYLNIEDGVRQSIKDCLVDICGPYSTGNSIARVDEAIFTGGIGIGKGQLGTNRALTPTGWRRISDLKVGDLVTGSDGRGHTVRGVYPRGKLETYFVSFSDGVCIEVDGDHLWTVSERIKTYRQREWKTLDTRTMAGQDLSGPDPSNRYRYKIPLVKPVHYDGENADLPIQPYLLGALLGDGCLTKGSIELCSDPLIDEEILDYIALPTGVEPRESYRRWVLSGKFGKQNPLMASMRALGLAGRSSLDKFIPGCYMMSSPNDRLELLRGMMDADGSNFGSNSSRYWTSCPRLAEQVIELVQSLGGVATRGEYGRPGRNREYWVGVNLPVNPFRLSRKADKWKPRKFKQPARWITHVEKSGCEEEIICISVDAPDNLYVTENFIVTHNTTIASIIISYMTHWVLCLRDPQGYFNLLPGSKIAMMMMSTTADQAKNVIFSDIKARVDNSPWFLNGYKRDPRVKNEIIFPGAIHIIPGDSKETTFEGYNILGGIIDEIDSHMVTSKKDYADDGYNTIKNRMQSRFGTAGLLVLIGQTKKASGFASRMYKKFSELETAYAVKMTIWESLGWDKFLDENGRRDSFFYDVRRHQILPRLVAEVLASQGSKGILEVPSAYKRAFESDPDRALKDLAGIPPLSGSPYIRDITLIELAQDKWKERYGDSRPVNPDVIDGIVLNDGFKFERPVLPRMAHVDIAYSSEGDALGLAIGHVPQLVKNADGEEAPIIVIDMIARVKALPGREIQLADIRRVLFIMKEKYGITIKKTTLDGFQSIEWMQAMRRRNMRCEHLSVDKSMAPYAEFRSAVIEQRIEIPPYVTKLHHSSRDSIDIVIAETTTLTDTGRKIDHLPEGSKDVLDCIAALCFSLTDTKSLRRIPSGETQSRGFDPLKYRPQGVAKSSSLGYPGKIDPTGGLGQDKLTQVLGGFFDGIPGTGRKR